VALAVYAGADDVLITARESGMEGVACVDDAARALALLCSVWEATRAPSLRTWCDGLLTFVLWMQDDDGGWVNFITDWEGTHNRTGISSVPGGAFWQARATHAMCRAAIVLGDKRADDALGRALDSMDAPAPPDVRALHVITALELLAAGRAPDMRGRVAAWTDELLSCQRDGMLLNSPHELGHPHLWGHVQEAALAGAGVLLGRDDVIAAAMRSADLVFAAAIDSGFDMPRTQPYDVASAIEVMDRLHAVTGSARCAGLAAAARAWFDGRNPAGQPVYNPDTGRVADGIDAGCVSANSGAEANIVAAQALFARVVEQAAILR
jgi:hypothetical protein